MLNIKDKKILYELDVNGFQSNSEIGKKVRLSKQVTGYRINKLEEDKIIRKIYSIYHLNKLGYTGFKVYFQMQNLDNEKKLINYFNENKNIIWFGIYEGRFDFVISVFAKNKVEFDKILGKIISDLKENIIDFEIASYSGILALKKDYLVEKRTEDKFSYFEENDKICELDKIDKIILKKLAENSRETSVDLAKITNLSPDTIINRIKKLKKNKIILGSRVMLDKRKLGIVEFKILLKLKNYNEGIHRKFIEFSKLNKNIVAYIKCIGTWNVELDIEMLDINEFHDLLNKIKTEFSDSIKSIETLMLYDEFKYNFYPF